MLKKIAFTTVTGVLVGMLGSAAGQSPAGQSPAATDAGRRMSVPLIPDAPSSYVVQKGDTLWDISARYLTQPWYWPEIWYVNPEIKNPHLIYPGDTLRLVFDGSGQPQIRVERGNTVVLRPQIRSTPLDQAITAIPYEIVAAFMSKPSVVSKEEADRLPYVVAQRERRVIGGMGDEFYARNVDAAPGTRYSVVHLGERIRDPDGGDFLGWQGVYTGTARLTRAASGEGRDALAKLALVESARETLDGDRLVAENLEVPLDFVPHAPAQPVDGRIISVVDGVSSIGQYQVVIVNRGTKHGLEPGHVLSIWQHGEKVKDRGPSTDAWSKELRQPFARSVRLPNERAGLMMVFRAYERMSYGLVLAASDAMAVGDIVQNPDAAR
jgi:hypothetical protein